MFMDVGKTTERVAEIVDSIKFRFSLLPSILLFIGIDAFDVHVGKYLRVLLILLCIPVLGEERLSTS